LITTGSFQDALNKANEIWEQIKEHKESEVKKYCRNVMAEALPKDDNFEAAEKFTEENFRCYNNGIRTIILMMRNALHLSNFKDMRRLGNQAEDILNNIFLKEDGNFVWLHFRMEIIDMINKTNELKNTGIQIDYNIKDECIMQHFLPPQLHEILIPDFSVKPADDVDLTYKSPVNNHLLPIVLTQTKKCFSFLF
jgi:hypothetical protein